MLRPIGSKTVVFSFKSTLMKTNDWSIAWNFHHLKVIMSAKPVSVFFCHYGKCLVRQLSSTVFWHRPHQVSLSSISPELRMQLLWPSWRMVTNCKQQFECELDLSEPSFNALLHSYCSGNILVFCRGEEELGHFLVSVFTGIQMHSYSVQLLWRVPGYFN